MLRILRLIMSSNDPKDKKPNQDYFDIEEYLEERLAELGIYEDPQYEEDDDSNRGYNKKPMDTNYFEDSIPKINLPTLKKDKSFVRYNILMKQYVNDLKAERGSEVVVIPGMPDETGRLLVRTMGTYILVPYEEVLDLGYN